MKKIFGLICLILLTGCTNVDTIEVDGEPITNQNTLDDLPTDYVPLDESQSTLGDISTVFQKLPDVYMADESFKSCAVQSIDTCISDFMYNNPENTTCEDYVTQDARNICKVNKVTKKAREEDSILVCDDLDEGLRDSCKNEVAVSLGLKTGEFDSCDLLSEVYIDSCKNEIILSRAIQARDESICDSLSSGENTFNYEIDFCKQEVEMQIENDEFEKQQLAEQERILKEEENAMNEKQNSIIE